MLNKTQHAKDTTQVHIPLKVINYCKAHFSVNYFVTQGFNPYSTLHKNLVTNKMNKIRRLKHFNPEEKLLLPVDVWQFLSSSKGYNTKKVYIFFYKFWSSFPMDMKSTNMIK